MAQMKEMNRAFRKISELVEGSCKKPPKMLLSNKSPKLSARAMMALASPGLNQG